MLRRGIISSGGVEALIGILLFAMSVYAGLDGRIPASSVVLDAAALLVVFVSLRWLRVGIAVTLVVIIGVLVFDPLAVGTALYLCMLPVITAIRRGRIPLAVVVTALNGVAGWTVSYRMMSDQGSIMSDQGSIGGPILTWLIVYGVVWAIGLGFGLAGKAAEERAETQFRERQLEVAWELHDSVARNLSILAMQADAARLSGSATASELGIMADQARLANQSIREVTRLLGAENRSATPTITALSALNAGRRELESLGFDVQMVGAMGDNLPMTVDMTVGQLLGEALHNVAKHGVPHEPCVISFDSTPETLGITLRNEPAVKRTGSSDGWGLVSMRHRAEAIGGSVRAQQVKGNWECEISLPRTTEESVVGES